MPKINRDILTISLILIFISSIYASPNYNTQSIFAQNESSEPSTVLSCEFVQFCSKPTEISRNSTESSVITPSDQISSEVQTTQEDEVQTTQETSELIPDVTSNISLIMTPDLPENIATDELQNSVDQELQSINETIQPSIDNSTANTLGAATTENATVITPASEIPSQSLDENLTIAIQNVPENETTFNSNNQSQTSDNISGSKLAFTTGQNATSEFVLSNETIDTTAANETIDTTAANETIDTTAANETI
ncbi:MAG TPA: hypothetical protein VD815_05015, partial [Candidatus Saccharimonadales bacterium]|nr:hypothetical protein [Candidatus Saccharimonadales bacterium]